MASLMEIDSTESAGSMTTRDYLLDAIDHIGVVEAFSMPSEQLEPLQVKAAQEFFALRRMQIPVLDRRARETGIESIESLDDIVPLLFSHTTYKSYPMSFVTEGRWDRLLRWFSTLVSTSVEGVDLSRVTDFDGFIAALWASGNCAVVTNGTTGKVSLLNRTTSDNDRYRANVAKTMAWPNPATPEHAHHVFKFMPDGGPYLMMVASAAQEYWFAKPGSIHALSDQPLEVAGVVRMAQMRTRIAEGTASPGEIADFEAEMRGKAERNQARASEMTDMLIDLRHEPMIIGGPWLQMWNVMLRARDRGIGEGEFHPDTIIVCGGGTKNAPIPPDYREQIMAFLGPVRANQAYGMSEMSWQYAMCEAGNYHICPWIVPLLLDVAGERLMPRQGVQTGRFAFLDLGFDGRWGGMITGDKVTIDFTQTCGCGRKGAVMHPEISRFAALGEEDKIGCAGTIDGYIKGALSQ
jgi:hypothetical protein